jgi:hypothetical protein
VSSVGDGDRATRALAQYQGAIGLVARASARGAITALSASREIAAIASISLKHRDEYDGQVVAWLTSFAGAHAPQLPTPAAQDGGAEPALGARDPSRRVFPGSIGALDDAVLRLVSGPLAAEPETVVWEGTRYRVDFTSAEVARLAATLGEGARPYLSAAAAVHSAAALIETAGADRERRRAPVALLADVGAAAPWEPDIVSALDRAVRESTKNPTRASTALRLLADELLARGLMDLAYAPALGYPDRTMITAHEAAGRHDFGIRALSANPWWLPAAGTERGRDWRVTGSLLNLDVRLSDLSLRRLTSRPPPRAPTMPLPDRRVFSEAMILMQPQMLRDAERARLVSWIRAGRTRLSAARTPDDVRRIADASGLDPVRRSLLAWTVAHDRDRLPRVLAPSDLLALGRDAGGAGSLDAWGVSAEPRIGCLCLRFPAPHTVDLLTSRADSGVFATGFVDLNLRLSELLDDLGMPAAMLAPVLESATLDLIERSVTRHRDDRRGWIEFVHGLTVDRVELYLGLLTTDGPLVPIGEQVDRAAVAAVNPRERR